MKSVPISVICNQGVHIIFVILNERLVLKNIEGKKLQLMLLRYKSGEQGSEKFEAIALSQNLTQHVTMANGSHNCGVSRKYCFLSRLFI